MILTLVEYWRNIETAKTETTSREVMEEGDP